MEKKYDLHIHSLHSDGTFTVEEICKKAMENKLKGISITDHDSIENIDELIINSKKYGIEFIPGIEFSCDLFGYEVHILGYFNNIDEKIKERLLELSRNREERNIKIIEKLKKLGLKIEYRDVLEEKTGNIVSRTHIAKAIIKKGYCYTKEEVFKQYIGKNSIAYVESKNVNAIDIVKFIKERGGVSVLAHPKYIGKSDNDMEKVLKELIANGLDGLECEYGAFLKEERKKYSNIAKEYGLIITGGSDFHGANRADIDIGDGCISEVEFNKISKLCYERRKK